MKLDKLLSVATKIVTPLSLSSLIVIVLYLLYTQVLNLPIFSKLDKTGTYQIIGQVLFYLFILAIVGIVLGMILYFIVKLSSTKYKKNSSSFNKAHVKNRDRKKLVFKLGFHCYESEVFSAQRNLRDSDLPPMPKESLSLMHNQFEIIIDKCRTICNSLDFEFPSYNFGEKAGNLEQLIKGRLEAVDYKTKYIFEAGQHCCRAYFFFFFGACIQGGVLVKKIPKEFDMARLRLNKAGVKDDVIKPIEEYINSLLEIELSPEAIALSSETIERLVDEAGEEMTVT